MSLSALLKPPGRRGRPQGTTIRLPADLRERLQRANARLAAAGYKAIPLQQLAVASLAEACEQLEKMTAEKTK